MYKIALTLLLLPLQLVWAESTTMIFIGGSHGESSSTLEQLQRRLARVEDSSLKNTWVVLTGNYSRRGPLPGKNSQLRDEVESDLRLHTDALSEFVRRGGRVQFLAGNNEDSGGRKSVRRLRKFLNRELGSEQDVMPHPHCGEPVVHELGETAVFVVLNSQWWMKDWSSHAKMNQGCEVKSRMQFLAAFDEIAKKYRTRRVIFSLYHPLESLGEFGGNFSPLDHLKPPLFGSLWVWAKQSGLIPQYRGHAMYHSLSSSILSTAQKYGSYVFVSGHDKNLQFLQLDQQVQIVSGHSGTSAARVSSPDRGEFSQSTPGWVELQIGSGQDQVLFVRGSSGKVIAKKALPQLRRPGRLQNRPPKPFPSSPVTSYYSKRRPGEAGAVKSFLLGDHYRQAYNLNLDFEVLDLSRQQGGLMPIKVGGGNQTNSLRLEDTRKNQWVLRSTTKDSSRLLPFPFGNFSFLKTLIEDGFTATHPAAATAVPPMADAVGIYHTRPRLMYVPDQIALDPFRGYVTDEVVLFERRPKTPKTKPPFNAQLPSHLGWAPGAKYISTLDMFEKVKDKPWKHQVDQEMFLRARLLDLFLGDWDRHEDQWRFVTKQVGKKRIYQPIPRDRDQVFSHYDGAIMTLLRLAIPNTRVLGNFDEDIRSLDWLGYNARFVDAAFLNRLTYRRWMEIAKEVQAALTDEVISAGLATWPKQAYQLDGATVERKLRVRRTHLIQAAEEFYQKMRKNVEVLGSEGKDRIELTYAKNGRVSLTVRRDKNSSQAFYSHTFESPVTKEVRIYGLDGRDTLVVQGQPHDDIQIRFIGGSGTDQVQTTQNLNVQARSLAVYDRKKGMKISPKVALDDQRSESSYRNQYDFHDSHHEPVKFGGMPFFQLNPDDGLYLTGSLQLVLPGFKRSPFASSHKLSAALATNTNGASGSYSGLFPKTLGPLDQTLEVSGHSSTSTDNFFGLTNRFVDTDPEGRNFYRVRQGRTAAKYGVQNQFFGESFTLGLKALYQSVDVERTSGRFISETTDVSQDAFRRRHFAGGILLAKIDTLDRPSYPKRGIQAEISSTVRQDITSADEAFGTSAVFAGQLSTHIPLDRRQRWVFSTRFKSAGIVGESPFYFFPTLGSHDLRSFNAEQLRGNGVFSQTSDLRWEALRVREGLPGALGFALSFDHGRAFGDDVSGSTYHMSVGGSVFWNVLDMFGLNVGLYHGKDSGNRLAITIGPLFSSTEFSQ